MDAEKLIQRHLKLHPEVFPEDFGMDQAFYDGLDRALDDFVYSYVDEGLLMKLHAIYKATGHIGPWEFYEAADQRDREWEEEVRRMAKR